MVMVLAKQISIYIYKYMMNKKIERVSELYISLRGIYYVISGETKPIQMPCWDTYFWCSVSYEVINEVIDGWLS